jgi:AcrR family transcriptional regulator
MPRTKEQNEALRAEKKQLIMDAALEVFAEAGYAMTSIDQIAKRAGVAKGLIYTYFESKEHLLHQILKFGVKQMSEGLFPEQMTPEMFVDSVAKMCDNVTTYRYFYKLYTALSVQPEVTSKLGPLTDEHRGLHAMVDLYKRHFGDRATQEILLMSSVSKGYSILALFGDRQKTIPLDLLKETVVDFVKRQFNLSE